MRKLLGILTFVALLPPVRAEDRPPALDPLTEKLTHRDDKVRRQAMRDLAKLGAKAKPAVPALLERAVQEHLPEMSKEAQAAITKIQPDVGPHVTTLLESTDPPALIAAANALGKLGPTEGVRGSLALRVAIYRFDAKKYADPAVVVACLAALGAVLPNHRDVVGEVGQAAVLGKNVTIRQQAAQTAGMLGVAHPEHRILIIKHLQIAFRDPEPAVRAAAFTAVGSFGADAKAVLRLLVAANADENEEVRQAAKAAGDAIEKAPRNRP